MHREAPGEGAEGPLPVLTRLAGAGAVGLAATHVAPTAFLALLFGAWLVALALAALTVVVLVVGLLLVYRSAGGAGRAGAWVLRVAVGGTLVAATGAGAWWVSGRPFGREPLVWQLAVASAFVIAAGVGTPRVRWPALLAAGAVTAMSSAVLLPHAVSLLPDTQQRGCIASSPEEAARACP